MKEAMAESDFVPVLAEAELPQGAKREVMVAGKPILLCHSMNQIHAVSNICSHAEEKLDCGRLGAGWIACPVHGARFDLATGQAKNPPAKQPIPVYPVRIADGWIEVGTEPVIA
jgi:3-phenylpropionate/trans-cinnamate dioxygenase ferredoxin component